MVAAEQYTSIFKPLDWHVRPFHDYSSVLLLTGAAGGGKSRLAGEKIHAYCSRYPGSTAVVLRKTRESTKNSVVLFLDKVIIGNDRHVRHMKGDRRFEYANGSMIIYGGMKDDQQREQIRSVGISGGVDIVWMEEATQFVEADFNEILARMRGQAGAFRQIILTTNPDNPYHWIYKRLIQGREASVYYSNAAMNLYNPRSYLRILKTLTGIQRARLVDGKWTIAEGAVYAEFTDETHVRNRAPKIEFKQVIAGVDWGYINAGVIQVYGVDGDGRMWLLEEVYKSRELIDWWVGEGKRLKTQWGVEKFACDPAMPAYIEAFNQADLNADKAINDIMPGIDAVKERLKVQPDGLPRLILTREGISEPDPILEENKKPTSVLYEIPGYVWSQPKGGVLVKEMPIKADDHGCDCLRYAVMEVDQEQGVLLW